METNFFNSVAFGATLQAMRKDAGFKGTPAFSKAIEDETGITIHPTTLKNMERGESVPSTERFFAIMATIGASGIFRGKIPDLSRTLFTVFQRSTNPRFEVNNIIGRLDDYELELSVDERDFEWCRSQGFSMNTYSRLESIEEVSSTAKSIFERDKRVVGELLLSARIDKPEHDSLIERLDNLLKRYKMLNISAKKWLEGYEQLLEDGFCNS